VRIIIKTHFWWMIGKKKQNAISENVFTWLRYQVIFHLKKRILMKTAAQEKELFCLTASE